MFCPNCGQQTDEDARFCRHCGHQLLTAASPAPSDPPPGLLRSNVSTMEVAAPRGVVYAGFWRRFAASIIDTVVVTILSFVVGFVVGFFFGLLAPRSTDVGTALDRNLAKIISALLLCIGYVMVAFTSRKQGLHDMIASTLVVVRPST